MTAVFVHGNPESSAIWNDLFSILERDDLVALSPPGFGAPIPDRFELTREAYAEWLIAELEPIVDADGPVDLVGHDWGGGHVLAVAMDRPDLLRTWVTDVIGLIHPDYVWHGRAQIWQTEGDGEADVAGMVNESRDDMAALFEALGMSPTAARTTAEAVNADMGRAILGLYRSAAQPAMVELGTRVEDLAATPGLCLLGENDHYVGSIEMANEMAAAAGATFQLLDGVGHWWMMEDPTQATTVLEEFWA